MEVKEEKGGTNRDGRRRTSMKVKEGAPMEVEEEERLQ